MQYGKLNEKKIGFIKLQENRKKILFVFCFFIYLLKIKYHNYV
ncbi:hypothetical protein D920_02324 [Enterococcus faecalis 13-SD-W-01]|nr:hypothetical protein D920_02324 [Enterococcus faecalis 13-SD-W-01]